MNRKALSFNPYPGLRPFRQDEDHLFFGREEQTMELQRRLGDHRFLAVVGPSGSGKSSLVRCGLLSQLLGGKLLRAGAAWEVAVTHPGGDPLGLLAESLLEADLYDANAENAREQVLATLSRSHFGLIEAVRQARLAGGTNFLLVVDQFEEIFRFHEAGQVQQEVANEFVSLLLEAASQVEVSIYVVLTMRSDFIGDCGQFEGLAEAVNQGEFLMPRLTREQFKRVIDAPAKVAGGGIAPRLLQRLLNDLGQQADQLPCLQHALMRTWTLWAESGGAGDLDLEDYRRVGQMSEALSLHADEIYESLRGDRERDLCAGLFRALTAQESEERGVRRPQRLGSLCEILDAPMAELTLIIDAYRQHGVTFLMPPPEVELAQGTIIDLSHESLMRVWKRLGQWVDEEAQSARIYRRLAETAALHAVGKAALYHDPDLQIALSWKQSNRPTSAWAERYHAGFDAAIAFLDKSAASQRAEEEAREVARRRELEHARVLAEEQRLRADESDRFARRLKWLVRGLGLVAMVALAAMVYAIASRKTAMENELLAQESAAKALEEAERADAERESARRILYAADMNLVWQAMGNSNFGRAARVLNRHWPQPGEEDLRGWEWRFLWQQTQGDQLFSLGPLSHHVFTIDYSPDDSLLVAGEFHGRVSLWDVATRKEVRVLVEENGFPAKVAFSPTGSLLAASDENGRVQLWNWPSGEELSPLVPDAESDGGSIRSISFSADGRRLCAYGIWQGLGPRVLVWDLENRSVVSSIPGQRMSAHHGIARLSPDGSIVYAGGFDGHVRAHDLASTEAKFDSPAHEHGITALALSPDGQLLATGSGYADWAIKLWNAQTGEYVGQLEGHTGWVCWLEFTPDGASLASASADQTARIWDVEQREEKATLRGHLDEVYGLAVSSGGQTVATACKDGTMNLWSAEPEEKMVTYRNRSISSAAVLEFSPDGKTLLTLNGNREVVLLDAETLDEQETLADLGRVFSASFSPDGRQLVVGVPEGTRVYDLVNKQIVMEFEQPSFPATYLDGGKTLVLFLESAVEFWNTTTWQKSRSVETGDVRPFGVVSPPGETLVTPTSLGEVTVWRLTDAGIEQQQVMRPHKRRITGAEFSPDGRFLGTCASDGSAFLFDTRTWEPVYHLRGHLQAVHSIRFSPDGRRVATGGGNLDAVKIWDVATGQEVLTLSTKSTLVTQLCFSPDGNSLAAISSNNANPVLQLWQAPPTDEVKRQQEQNGKSAEADSESPE